MYSNQAGTRRPWNVWRRTAVRALLLGLLAAIVGGAAGTVCGAVFCLADGLPWDCAARGASAACSPAWQPVYSWER